MRRLISIEEFAKLNILERDAESLAIATTSLEALEFGDSGRLVTYTFSTPAVGRDMHTVAPEAWQLANYARNPVFLWFHDDSQPPIGRVIDIGNVGGKLKGTVEYAEAELSPFADMIYRMVKARYINAVSTSWQPLTWKFSSDKNRQGGVDFTRVDLLEISQVPVPALPSALAEARSNGIDTAPMVEWAERLLDRGGMAIVPRTELETLRRAAIMSKPKNVPVTEPPAAPLVDDKAKALKERHARAISRAPKLPVFKRGLYEVAQMAYTLSQLGYLHDCAEYEADIEGDDSEVPDMIAEALTAFAVAFKAAAEEETDELLAAHTDEDEVEEVETRMLSADDKAFIAAATTPRARAWRAGLAVARAGKALSASNKEKLEDGAAHLERGLKHHRQLGEHHEAVSGHLKEARAAHGELTSTLAELGEHVRAAAENPEEAAPHLKRAVKAHKDATEDADDVDEAHDDLDDRHEDVGDSNRAMGRSIKSAQRCMRSVTDGAETSEPDNKDADDLEDDEAAKADKARRQRQAEALRLRGSPIT